MNEWKYKLDDAVYIKHQDSYEDDYGSLVTDYKIYKLVGDKRVLVNNTGDLPFRVEKCKCCGQNIYIHAEYMTKENIEAIKAEEQAELNKKKSSLKTKEKTKEIIRDKELAELERLKKKYENN